MSISGNVSVPVGIVGAGPVGMTCALRLASFGIPCVILETDPALRKQGSKACLIQGDALEVLDKVGCGEQISAEGMPWHIGHTYVRGQEILRSVYPQRVGFAPFINISQYRIEQVLLASLEANPLCEIRWGHHVENVTQNTEGVTAHVSTPEGMRHMHFQYLIACDGVRSEIRTMIGVEWTGYTHDARFLITDIRVKLPLAKERHFHYDPPSNPGRQLVMHPQPNDIWRIDWQLPPDADIDMEKKNGQLDQRIRAVIGDLPYEIDWLSTYRFRQRVVAQLKVLRVLFAGDAAHSFPPYGSRGMNSGIQDADNLAWKLALVLQGQAQSSLLDTYHTERYAAAVENLRVTEATIKFMVPPNPFHRWLRNIVLRLSRPFKSVRQHVNSGKMAEPYTYTDSPINEYISKDPLIGSFAPDSIISVANQKTRLRKFFGNTFVCLYFGNDPQAGISFAKQILMAQSKIRIHIILAFPASAGVDDLSDDRITIAHYNNPELATQYQSKHPRWYLVRPDGHIAGAYDAEHCININDIISRCTGGQLPSDKMENCNEHYPPILKAS